MTPEIKQWASRLTNKEREKVKAWLTVADKVKYN